MFGIGWPEFLVIIAVAVIVIGPKDLPRALYAAGKLVRKFKLVASDVQKSLDDVIRDEELEEITREANRPGGENLQFEIERQLVEEKSKKSTSNG